MTNDTKPDHSFERRIQSIIQSVVLALVMWIGYTVLALRDSSIKQEFLSAQAQKDAEQMRTELSALRAQVVNALAAQTATAAAVAATAATVADDRRTATEDRRKAR